MKNSVGLLLAVLVCSLLGCSRSESPRIDCVKGKYLGRNCGGAVIGVLDQHTIGADFAEQGTQNKYTNAVLAHIDSTLAKSIGDYDAYFATDSIIYFQYRNGGYPHKQYDACDPWACITITLFSKTPCEVGKPE